MIGPSAVLSARALQPIPGLPETATQKAILANGQQKEQHDDDA
jgi:hypothetical protein